MSTKTTYLSIVIPVYQGRDYLHDMVQALKHLKDEFHARQMPVELAEVLFVDDESIDDSASLLDELAADYDWIRVITLARNFGQHSATVAGILHSSGDWVATLDEDLQHPPDKIPAMLEHAVLESLDVVFANPRSGVHGSMFRDKSSGTTKALIGRLSNNPHVRYFNSFRLIRGTVARAAASVASHDTYFDVALCWFTSRVGVVKMELTDDRHLSEKKSGYNLRALFRHARRLLITSEIKLIRVGAFAGVLAMFTALVFGIAIVLWTLLNPESIEVRGWASTIVVILFFSGLISFLLGIVLEFMSVILLRAQGKPTLFVIDRSMDVLLSDWFKGRVD